MRLAAGARAVWGTLELRAGIVVFLSGGYAQARNGRAVIRPLRKFLRAQTVDELE